MANMIRDTYPVSASLGALKGEIGIFKPVVYLFPEGEV